MKVTYRFYDSSDSTILSQYFYESDVPILRFYFKIIIRVVSVLTLKERGIYMVCLTPRRVDVIFSDLAIIF